MLPMSRRLAAASSTRCSTAKPSGAMSARYRQFVCGAGRDTADFRAQTSCSATTNSGTGLRSSAGSRRRKRRAWPRWRNRTCSRKQRARPRIRPRPCNFHQQQPMRLAGRIMIAQSNRNALKNAPIRAPARARESVRPRSVWRELGCARMSTAGKHEPLCEEFAHGQVAVNLWLVLCLRARRVRMASARKNRAGWT